jgi:hypothetical protein
VAVIESSSGARLAEVGEASSSPLHVSMKAFPPGGGPNLNVQGHFRHSIKLTLAAGQNANSRLWNIRHEEPRGLIVITRLFVQVCVSGTVTTPYLFDIGLRKYLSQTNDTGTSGLTTNGSSKYTAKSVPRASHWAHVYYMNGSVAGGMSAGSGGGTREAQDLGRIIGWAVTADATTEPYQREFVDDMNNGHPIVLPLNMGLGIDNVVVGSATSNAVQVAVDASWFECNLY